MYERRRISFKDLKKSPVFLGLKLHDLNVNTSVNEVAVEKSVDERL